MRKHLIGTENGEAEISRGEAVGHFLSWSPDETNQALSEILTWPSPPTAARRLGALAESVADVAAQRAELTETRQADRAGEEASQ